MHPAFSTTSNEKIVLPLLCALFWVFPKLHFYDLYNTFLGGGEGVSQRQNFNITVLHIFRNEIKKS